MSQPAAGPRGWVLFDDSCGFCSSWVRRWARTLHAHGFEIAPLQDDWVRKQLGSPSEEDLLLDLRLLLDDGRQLCGADAYRYVMRRIWWAYPVLSAVGCAGPAIPLRLGLSERLPTIAIIFRARVGSRFRAGQPSREV